MKNTFFKHITMLAVALCATACSYENHFLDEDEPEPGSYDMLWNVGISDYESWTYINLITGETETHSDTGELIYSAKEDIRPAKEEATIGIEWHIAVHRYEFKTNGASVFNTGKTDIMTVTELPEGTYAPDEVVPYETESKKEGNKYLLTIDMSGMMDEKIGVGYSHNPTINRVLCDGIKRTATGTMPPTIYETKREVLVLKWGDGSWSTLQVTDTKHTVRGVDHYMSFYYNYHSAK
ncbi:HmuY family protein [Bacteroides sp. 51]|uniref:HmuY family protein n=1 Tax=Bacteroides sp. 51 TaxID=2302938 RepID=UPI0013D15EA6|nr:HmuY family protein [Bacteroides sp. 51]NDV82987.1 hypothetical protein [Bacteroides sp. 51]